MPTLIGCDASSLLLQKKYIQGTKSPKDTKEFNDVKVRIASKVRKLRVVYIKDVKLRDRLKAVIIDKKIRNYNNDDVKVTGRIDQRTTRKLYSDLNRYGCDKVVDMMKYMEQHMATMDKELIKKIGDLLRGLSSYMPLYHIIPNQITELLKDYSNANWQRIKQKIQNYQPLIYSVHERFVKSCAEPPTCWFSLIKELAMLSSDCVTKLESARSKSPPIPTAQPKHQSMFDDSGASGCCYGYKMHHTRPTYDYDSESKTLKHVGECNKYYHEFNAMSNGICTFKCLEHEEMIGYHVMREPEGLNDYFSLLITIYKDNDAPKLVLCDNACQLNRYCMHREPQKFKNTLFLNDEIHSKGHKCGPLYCIKPYKDSLTDLSFLNDPSIEQTNRILKYLKISTMYMKLQNFMSFVTNLLEIESRKSIRKRDSD